MCFDALVNGDGIDRPLAAVLAELPAALRTGLLAAAFVVVAALAGGTPSPVVGQLALLAGTALLVGIGAHLAVLLAGIGVLRLRAAAGAGRAAAA